MDQLLLKDRALAAAAEGITIADALSKDRPLIYVNEGFERLTGYVTAHIHVTDQIDDFVRNENTTKHRRSGCMISEPVPVAQSLGAKPIMVVNSVNNLERNRWTAASMTASRTCSNLSFSSPPRSRSLLADTRPNCANCA